MAPLKILISGGGIAGNALAFWLSKLGHSVSLVEWFPTLRATGLQIDLRGPGIEVLKYMGLEPSFLAKSVAEQGMKLVDTHDKQVAFFPANKSGKGVQSFTSEYEILRGDLCQILYKAAEHQVSYIFGASITSIENNDSHVKVILSNGQQGNFDLVVGADGVASRTRKMIFPQDDGFRSIRAHMAYFTTKNSIHNDDEQIATYYMAADGLSTITRRHNMQETQVYLICNDDIPALSTSKKDVKVQKAIFADRFNGIGWKAKTLVEAMNGSEDFYCENLGLVKLDSWSKGRVTFLGDAAHCPTAYTGMGTTSALVGAYILAGEVSKHCPINRSDDAEKTAFSSDILGALKGYEDVYRPFIIKVQKGVENDGNWLPRSRMGIYLLNWLLYLLSLVRFDWIGRYGLGEFSIKDWELPDYPLLRSTVSPTK